MCGILGTIGDNKIVTPEHYFQLLCHRGPDHQGFFSDSILRFYHSRLAIQDLSIHGNQPMSSPDGNFIIIYNGEIYNHWEIRKKLENKYSFKSYSDTETILFGFIEYGKAILNMLNGIFSFAIYNKQSGDLFIARDPYGVKPLYYFHSKKLFAFASEIKVLTSIHDFDFTLDYSSLLNNILFLYNPGPNTNYSIVKKLLPGHYLELNVQNHEVIKITKYFDIPFNGSYSDKSEIELLKDLEEILFKVIERQSISDIPKGFFLSGGIDSSLLVAMTKAIYPDKKLQCFTVRNTHKTHDGFQDDYPYANYLAQQLNLDLQVVESRLNLKDLDSITLYMDEIYTDPAAFHTYEITKKAKEMGYKVLYSGIGADELFSGYRRHQSLKLNEFTKKIPASILYEIYRFISRFPVNNIKIRRLQKLLKHSNSSLLENMFAYHLWIDISSAKELFTYEIKEKLEDYNPYNYYESLLKNIPNETSELNKILYWDLKTYLPDNNLNYTDKMGMANGVEIRVPYLDNELADYTYNLPPHFKMKGITTKYLLRKVAKKYLPEKIINRSKTGFGSPIRQLIKTEWSEVIKNKLSKEEINNYGIFDPSQIQKLILQNKAGKIDAAYPLFSLLLIQSWLKQTK